MDALWLGAKVLSTALAANLINRYRDKQAPFDGSWAVVRLIGPLRLKRDKPSRPVGQKLLTYQPAERTGVLPEHEPSERG